MKKTYAMFILIAFTLTACEKNIHDFVAPKTDKSQSSEVSNQNSDSSTNKPNAKNSVNGN